MPVLQSAEVEPDAKRHVADLVVRQGKLLGGNFSDRNDRAGRRPGTDGARPSRRWRLAHHRPEDVRVHAGGRRLLPGAGVS